MEAQLLCGASASLSPVSVYLNIARVFTVHLKADKLVLETRVHLLNPGLQSSHIVIPIANDVSDVCVVLCCVFCSSLRRK